MPHLSSRPARADADAVRTPLLRRLYTESATVGLCVFSVCECVFSVCVSACLVPHGRRKRCQWCIHVHVYYLYTLVREREREREIYIHTHSGNRELQIMFLDSH